MKLKPRTLIPLLGLTLFGFTASAQHEEYLTEATVEFTIQFGTHIIKPADADGVIVTTPITSRVGNKQILEHLLKTNIIDSPITDWKLVAVRAAPADVRYVNGGFSLYVVKEHKTDPLQTQRIPYPAADFRAIASSFTLRDYTETHQGANVINSRGTATSYTAIDFTPTFVSTPVVLPPTTVGNDRVNSTITSAYELNRLRSAGYATINFLTRADQPIFFIPIQSMSFVSVGDFTGSEVTTTQTTLTALTAGATPRPQPPQIVTDDPNIPNAGLVIMRVNVGAAKLVRQSDYPLVPYFPFSLFP